MAQDVETEGVEQQEPEREERRRGILPLIALVALVLLILWLLWQFFGARNSNVTTVKTVPGATVVPPVTSPPGLPAEESVSQADADQPTVPNVVGQSEQYAQSALESAGYTAIPTYVNSDEVRAGIVIGQSPGGGSVLPEGSEVGIVVSRGKAAVIMVSMPNVIGLTQSAAEAKVEAAGLKPYILHGTDARFAGKVGSQWPYPGEKLPKGSEGFIQVMIER